MTLLRFAARAALLSGTALPFASLPAYALTAPVAPAAADAATPDSEADIIVTATRRSERLQDVPISVTAVRGETLAERGVTNPEELARLTPTLTTQSGASNQQGTNFSIRGVGTSSFQRTIESSVATVIDDVTLIRPEMGIMNFTDVDQVEVLNGPQGMLFGKNASAGLVSVRTKNPVLGEASGRFGTEYSRLNTANDTSQFRVFGIANLPVSDTVATRFNLLYQYNTPIYKNLATNPRFEGQLRQILASGKLLWQPDDRLSVLVAGDYADLKGLGPGIFSFRSVAPGSPNGFFLSTVGITPSADNTFSAYSLDTFANTRIGGAQVKIDYDLGGGTTLTNIAAYRSFRIRTGFDPDYGPFELAQFYQEPRGFKQWSNELRIASPVGKRFDYQVGLYVLRASLYQRTTAAASLGMAIPPGFTTFLGSDALQQQELGSYAVFGQGTYRITDALRVIAGARLTYDEIKMTFNNTSNGAVALLFPLANNEVSKRHTAMCRGVASFSMTSIRT
jgi:iron complex outermembrane receptor protein